MAEKRQENRTSSGAGGGGRGAGRANSAGDGKPSRGRRATTEAEVAPMPEAAPASAAGASTTSEATKPTRRGGSRASGAATAAGGAPDLRKDLRDFAAGRPSGWGHDDWLNFLESLRSRGHNVNDTDAIGMALERERLDLALSAIKGLGPQKRQALVERYGTVWSLRNADADEIAQAGKISRDVAERVKAELR